MDFGGRVFGTMAGRVRGTGLEWECPFPAAGLSKILGCCQLPVRSVGTVRDAGCGCCCCGLLLLGAVSDSAAPARRSERSSRTSPATPLPRIAGSQCPPRVKKRRHRQDRDASALSGARGRAAREMGTPRAGDGDVGAGGLLWVSFESPLTKFMPGSHHSPSPVRER